MSFMKHNEDHLDQDKLIEYLYGESPNPEEVQDHLRVCQRCHKEYLGLKKDMESVSDHLKQDFWHKQRKEILSMVAGIQGGREASLAKWLLRPAFVIIILIVLFVGIYSRLNHSPIRYTERDISEEIFLEHVAELVDQPLTSALDYLDFQEDPSEPFKGFS